MTRLYIALFLMSMSALRTHAEDPTIRLVGGSSNKEGRVEFLINGVWGTVCDDNFNFPDANVVCRQLGFEGAIETKREAFFGAAPESTPIYFDELGCTGSESSIAFCSHDGVGTHDCSHSEDAGVVCHDPVQVRLVGGNSEFEGRVEVAFNGQWGTICHDSFDMNEATVLCRQLGFGGPERVRNAAFFGGAAASVKIWLDDLTCTGSESNIVQCRRLGGLNYTTDDSDTDIGRHNCDHGEDAGVVCSAPPSSSTTAPPSSSTTAPPSSSTPATTPTTSAPTTEASAQPLSRSAAAMHLIDQYFLSFLASTFALLAATFY